MTCDTYTVYVNVLPSINYRMLYIMIHYDIYLYLCIMLYRDTEGDTPNLPINMLDFSGFDSSVILSVRGETIMSTGNVPETLSQQI